MFQVNSFLTNYIRNSCKSETTITDSTARYVLIKYGTGTQKLMPLQPKNSNFKATGTLFVVLLGFFGWVGGGGGNGQGGWGVGGFFCLVGLVFSPFLLFHSDQVKNYSYPIWQKKK